MPQQESQNSQKSSNRSSSNLARFRTIKSEIRILGIDDGPFNFTDSEAIVIGAVLRGGDFLDGVLSTTVKVDGTDATQKIIEMINSSRHKNQLRAIMLDGITLAGFNVIDISKINKETGLPAIVIVRRKPDLEGIKKALEKFADKGERLAAIERAGPIKKYKSIYFQSVGLDEIDAKSIISLTITHSKIPEPIRIAHLIAGGVVKGESRGRA